MIGTVIYENVNGHTLVQVGERLYIAGYVGVPKGQEMAIDERLVLEVPSALFGLSLMAEKDMKKVIKFVKEKW